MMAGGDADLAESATREAKVMTTSDQLEPALIQLGAELGDEQLQAFGSMAKVWSAVKQAKRDMKKRQVA
ncbi:hypothetical protein PF005_g18084 [Phytophthora fragariae]|nr:hypothetical protein PF011_g17581 [Phytophthora fragariae]KAE9104924.1 hypothetical protein PF007_g13876 [Phytophthora fragariae]KAE9142167.1 hypothetical protein PF006_g12704 [Phytophthora fragariae]KAE9193399.1 hypothetical protein PF005_g18084 [Phytophthora fragariae]KAE9222294.1 hypothetical protein PF004_g12830 [Phytophthora fragariae]